MKPSEEILQLADRIDTEELWRRPGIDHDDMTPEQKDRLMAGVYLRRYAMDRGVMLEQLKEGKQYIRGVRLERANRGTDQRGCGDYEWHRACNRESEKCRIEGKEWPRILYSAMKVSDEVPRMVLLFQREREQGMPASYKMCAHDPSPPTPLQDNHLYCALGKECRRCEYLAAIDRSESMTSEAKDEAKAWTCATHFLLESKPDVFFESILRDKSDDAFDARLIRNLTADYPA